MPRVSRTSGAAQPATLDPISSMDHSAAVPTGLYASGPAARSQAAPSGQESSAATEQRGRIQHIAAQLFAKRGYRAIGVAEIGDAVGLGRGALYYHIGSKEDLLFNIVVRYIEDLVVYGRRLTQDEPDPKERIRQLSRYLMRTIASNLAEMTVCFREADALTGDRFKVVSKLHQEYQDIWQGTIKEGQARGEFRELPLVALKGILGMYFYSFLWLSPNGKQSADEIADIFSDMVFSILDKKNRSRKGVAAA